MMRNGPGKRAIAIASALTGIQSLLRLCFSYLGFTGGIGEFLTAPVSQETLYFINTVFLLLGVAGTMVALGLLMGKRWGLWCASLVLVSTVAFDLWGLLIQSTAAMGIVMPAVTMILLLKGRSRFAGVEPQ